MNKILKLAAVLRKCSEGGSDGKKERQSLFSMLSSNYLFLLLLVVLGSAVSAWIGTKLPDLAAALQAPTIGLTALQVLFALAALVSVVYSFPIIINMFYMSDDLPVLIVMPITSKELLLARLINLCPLFVAISFLATVPVGIAYAVTTSVAPSFYLSVVLAFLSIPVVALGFTGSVVILLLTFVGVLKNKDHLRVIGTILVFIGLSVYLFVSNNHSAPKGVELMGMILNTCGKYTRLFPTNIALEGLMIGFSVKDLVLALVIIAAFAVVFFLLADRLYLKGALSMITTSGSGQILDNAAITRESRKKSLADSIVTKDYRQVRRNPAYLMTGFIYPFLLPAVTFGALVMGMPSNDTGIIEYLRSVMKAFPSAQYIIGICIAIFTTLFAVGVNSIIATPLSREGASFMMLKQFPIPWKEFIRGKQKLALRLGHASASFYTLVAVLALYALRVLSLPAVIYTVLVHLALLYMVVSVKMLHDFKHPLLVWDNEAAMLKKAGNVLMIVFMFAGILLPFGLAIFELFVPQSVMIMVIAVPTAAIASAVFFTFRLYTDGVKALERL